MGGNVWWTRSTPPGSQVLQAQMCHTTVEPKRSFEVIHQPSI